MTALMEQDAQQIMSDLHNANDAAKLNTVSNQLSSVIYTACKNSYKVKKKRENVTIHDHCTSANFKAIAEINLHAYNYKINNDIPREICDSYLQNWMKYEELARNAVAVEFNIKENVAWKNIKTKNVERY